VSESKTLSKLVATTPHFGKVEYLSALEIRDDGVDPAEARFCTVTFDAIPMQLLPFLRRATSQEILDASDTALSFLLMEAEIPMSDFRQAEKNGGWCTLTVSDDPDAMASGEFYKATALEFSPEGQEFTPTILYVRVNSSQPAPKDLKVLKRITECRHHPSAVFDNLGTQPKDDLFIVVYDVGQANMCAILGDGCEPKAFFDFGWPITTKRWSSPNCLGFDPLAGDDPANPSPVLLSHLDWDHWGFAYLSGRPTRDVRGFWKTHVTYRPGALDRPWVMRRPSESMKLGISHAHLLFQLQNQILHDGSRALKFWPSARAQIQWGACVLFACTPAHSTQDAKYLRNNLALGLLVENPQSHYYQRVLLCGDADYTSIASRYKQSLCGIVAPHHGGRITPNSIPAPSAYTHVHPRMVFSTHEGCYSQIPSADTIHEASMLEWWISRTDERLKCMCGHAERRNRWFSLSTVSTPGSCQSCSCWCYP
jgi:hypothetical protein